MSRRLRIERLEDRAVPATFGIPWADRDLSLSFVPDGTPVSAGTPSDLFDSFNQVRSEQEWQREILRAYQTWARVANLNVAVTADSGDPLGTPGRWQGDGRFGDVRIAAADLQSSVLAIGTASDPGLAGTRAGDVVFNSGFRFDGSPYDLFTVALHEAGHSLGLDNSTNAQSAMFSQYIGQRTGLGGGDVAAVRALYGPRPADVFEGTGGNNTTARASDLGGVPTADTVLLTTGDLTTSGDRDVYSFLSLGPVGGNDHNITVKLQTAGVSLLAARITVYTRNPDGSEAEVANATMNPDEFTGGSTSVSFDANDGAGPVRYYVRVEKADGTAFDVGRYALGVSFSGDDEAFEAEDLTLLPFGPRPVLINADGNRNDTLASATVLRPTSVSTVLPNSRYETEASLSTPADADFYRVIAPAGTGPRVLTVNTQALSDQAAAPMITLYSSAGVEVPAAVLANDSGLLTVQATGLTAGATYFARVTGAGAGNYRLTADFGTTPSDVQTFAQGQVAGDAVTDTLYVARAQVMTFLVSAGGPAGSGVRLTVTDAAGNAVQTLFAAAGETAGGVGVLLRPGQYSVRIEAVRPAGYAGPLSVTVRGNRVDDPVGALPSDPTTTPQYTDPNQGGVYVYPGNVLSIRPFYWFTLLAP